MSEKKAVTLDPMRAWRDWFVGAEKDWSDALTNLMKDETVVRPWVRTSAPRCTGNRCSPK